MHAYLHLDSCRHSTPVLMCATLTLIPAVPDLGHYLHTARLASFSVQLTTLSVLQRIRSMWAAHISGRSGHIQTDGEQDEDYCAPHMPFAYVAQGHVFALES